MVPISSASAAAKLSLRPGSASSSSRLVLGHTGAADSDAGAFSMAVPGPMGGGLAVAAGDLEAVTFDRDAVRLGKHFGVGNLVEVRKELQIFDSSIDTKSADLRIAPAELEDLHLQPAGSGIVAVRGRDLKIDNRLQVGPQQT